MNTDLGPILYSFFEDPLKCQKGLRPSSLKSSRDSVKLFLLVLVEKTGPKVSRLKLADLTCAQVLSFLQSLETDRHNPVRTRNQRWAAIRGLLDYWARRVPERLKEAQSVAAIPTQRTAPAATYYWERDERQSLLASVPSQGASALRDRVLFLFLYNTGARVQEVADLRYKNLELEGQPRVHLHGKGDKGRVCPLWKETVALLKQLVAEQNNTHSQRPVFASLQGQALTRFGIYKIVRRHTRSLLKPSESRRRISPHVRGTPPPSRCGGKRNPRLVGTGELGDDQPLRGDQPPDEGGCVAGVPTAGFRFFGAMPPKGYVEGRRGTEEMA